VLDDTRANGENAAIIPNTSTRKTHDGSLVSTASFRAALIEGREMALLDVREEGPYSRGHPLFAVSLPLSRIELKTARSRAALRRADRSL